MSPNGSNGQNGHAADVNGADSVDAIIAAAPATSHKSTPKDAWIWTRAREVAAKLVAEDEITDEEIAAKCNVIRRTLATWKQASEFKARVQEHRERIRASVLDSGYCRLENRIKLRQRVLDSFVTIADERGARPEMQDSKVAGGKTGFVALQPRIIGTGENAKSFIEQVPDTSLAAEIRTGLKELAQEVGQVVEKYELGGIGGGPLVIRVGRDEAGV